MSCSIHWSCFPLFVSLGDPGLRTWQAVHLLNVAWSS